MALMAMRRIVVQALLIAFQRQRIVALLRDDLFGDGTPAVERAGGHEGVFQRQLRSPEAHKMTQRQRIRQRPRDPSARCRGPRRTRSVTTGSRFPARDQDAPCVVRRISGNALPQTGRTSPHPEARSAANG